MDWFYRYLPHHCHLCDARAQQYLCAACLAQLPLLGPCCAVCALPLPHNQDLCGDCLKTEKPYQLSVCAFQYRHPVDALLVKMKKAKPAEISRTLLPFLCEQLKLVYLTETNSRPGNSAETPASSNPWPDLLVPVPSHWYRRWQRGYNPAQELARQLAQRLHLKMDNALIKYGGYEQQKGLNQQQRLSNLKNAFKSKGLINGMHIALVDDVVTTGATAIRASQALRKAGAKRIDIWALARTPKH